MTQSKENKKTELARLMSDKSVSPDRLARELKVTTQTVYNMKRGNASDQLYEHAFMVLDNWEESK